MPAWAQLTSRTYAFQYYTPENTCILAKIYLWCSQNNNCKTRLYLTDFASHTVDLICTRVIWIVIHLLTENPWEFVIHCISKSCQCSTAICLDKLSMDILKESKWDTSYNKNKLIRRLLSHTRKRDIVSHRDKKLQVWTFRRQSMLKVKDLVSR